MFGSSPYPTQVCDSTHGQVLAYEYKTFDDDYFTYPKFEYKAYVLIINNEDFTNDQVCREHRRGSTYDVEGFHTALINLGINGQHIQIEKNKTKNEMKDILYKVSQKDFTQFASVIVAVFSFGEDFKVYATDELVTYKELMSPFSHANCPKLEDKPKVFFIETECLNEPLAHDALPPVLVSRDITEPDVLLAYSVEEPTTAWKTGGKGTWFIQSLIEVLRLDGRRLDLMTLMTRVNYLVRQCYETHVTHSASEANCPYVRSTLSKAFNLSYHDDY